MLEDDEEEKTRGGGGNRKKIKTLREAEENTEEDARIGKRMRKSPQQIYSHEDRIHSLFITAFLECVYL